MLGARLRYTQRSWPLGRRAAQYVEANPAAGAVVPRRQSAPVAPLFAVSRASAQGAHGGHPDAGVWDGGSVSSGVSTLLHATDSALRGRRQGATAPPAPPAQ